jgi:hypothetical protein
MPSARKIARLLAIALALYVALVAAFEGLLGAAQPSSGETLVMTTFDADGTAHDRVLTRLESEGRLYVAVNHWPRAWYHRVLERPEVQVTLAGTRGDYRAVPISGEEYARVSREHPLPAPIRVLTGFAPRELVRLDPR